MGIDSSNTSREVAGRRHLLAAFAASLLAIGCDPEETCSEPACEDRPGGKGDDLPDEPLGLSDGSWSEPITAPVHFLHGALLHTGRVVLFAGEFGGETDRSYVIWDPETEAFDKHPLPSDLLCSHHAQLPNGDLLLMGGGGPSAVNQQTWALILDAQTEKMRHIEPMNTARWYPTVVRMADGRVLVAGGHWTGSQRIDVLEHYDPATGTWTEIAGSERTWSAWYPALQVLPNGDLVSPFALGFAQDSGFSPQQSRQLRFSGSDGAQWVDTGNLEFSNRQEGTTVILVDDSGDIPDATIMVIGGGLEDSGGLEARAAPATVEILEAGDGTGELEWRRGADMAFERTNVSAVVLPTGRVMAIGGRQGRKFDANHRPVLGAEIYDLETDRWETTEQFSSIAAQYHNVSLLLPDGRVFSGGGNNPTLGGRPLRNQREFELFSPAYMAAERPQVTEAPTTIAYGQHFDVQVENASDIDAVSIISLGSPTHHTDAGGRHVRLQFEVSDDDTLSVRGPTDGNVMPPGHVMLYVIDGDVPSPARMVKVELDPEDS